MGRRRRERKLAEKQARIMFEANLIAQQQQMAQQQMVAHQATAAVYPPHPQAMGKLPQPPIGTELDPPPPYPGLGITPMVPQPIPQQVQVTRRVIHHEHECEQCRNTRRRKLLLGMVIGHFAHLSPRPHHCPHHHHHHC